MAMARVKVVGILLAMFALALGSVIPLTQAQEFAPVPAPASDGHEIDLCRQGQASLINRCSVDHGTTVDQGIAYVLMLLALVLTYLIHPMDATGYSLF